MLRIRSPDVRGLKVNSKILITHRRYSFRLNWFITLSASTHRHQWKKLAMHACGIRVQQDSWSSVAYKNSKRKLFSIVQSIPKNIDEKTARIKFWYSGIYYEHKSSKAPKSRAFSSYIYYGFEAELHASNLPHSNHNRWSLWKLGLNPPHRLVKLLENSNMNAE